MNSDSDDAVKVFHISEVIAMVLEEMRTGKGPEPLPCVVCGDITTNRSVHQPVCDPYGADGEIVKRCRWIHLGET